MRRISTIFFDDFWNWHLFDFSKVLIFWKYLQFFLSFSGVPKSYKRHKSTSATNIYNCSQVLLAIRTWATRRFRGQNRRNYSSHEWLEHGTSLWTNFQVCRLLNFYCVNFWIRLSRLFYKIILQDFLDELTAIQFIFSISVSDKNSKDVSMSFEIEVHISLKTFCYKNNLH